MVKAGIPWRGRGRGAEEERGIVGTRSCAETSWRAERRVSFCQRSLIPVGTKVEKTGCVWWRQIFRKSGGEENRERRSLGLELIISSCNFTSMTLVSMMQIKTILFI